MADKQSQDKSFIVQNQWLVAATGKMLTATLMQGHTITGRLLGFDRYTLVLDMPGESSSLLLSKHAVAYMSYKECRDE